MGVPSQSFNPRARGGRDEQGIDYARDCIPFQSTRPRGARHVVIEPHKRIAKVSIHAPAGGATIHIIRNLPVYEFQSTRPRGARRRGKAPEQGGFPCFNPRARGGRDVAIHGAEMSIMTFQSTRPRGARRQYDCYYFP